MEDVLDNEIEMDEVLEMGSGAIGYDEAIESPVPRGALKVLLPGDDVMGLEEHKVGGGPAYRCHRAVSSSRRTDGVRYPAFGAMDYLGRRQAVT